MRAVFVYVFAIFGFLGSVATGVSLVQHYADIPLSGVPLGMYAEYAFMRDTVFSGLSSILLSWWTDWRLSAVAKDAVSLYLFFGLAFNRTVVMGHVWVPVILLCLHKIELRPVDVKLMERPGSAGLLLWSVLLWPLAVWTWVRAPGEEYKIFDMDALDTPSKAVFAERRVARGTDEAYALAFLFTVVVTAVGVLAFYLWNHLESAVRAVPPA